MLYVIGPKTYVNIWEMQIYNTTTTTNNLYDWSVSPPAYVFCFVLQMIDKQCTVL